MKTYPRILAAMALTALCSYASGQDVTQTGDEVRFTFTDLVTRVPVSLPVKYAVSTTVGSNLLCHGPIAVVATGPSNDNGTTLSSSAGDLKAALFVKVSGKSADDLIALLEKVNKASGRDAKVQELFGIPPDQMANVGGRGFAARVGLTVPQQQLLEMGQPATVINENTAAMHGARCYSTQQIDQAIDEGGRVVKAIIRALQAPNSSPQPKSPG